MGILRPTRKLSTLLPPSGIARSRSDTALGDWYVNRIVVDRQPLLLLVSSTSLLPILVPARDVRSLPTRLGNIVKSRLVQLGIEAVAIDAEMNAMRPVEVGATVDRSVIGIMVDFANTVPYHLERGHWSESTLPIVGECLAETPCHAGRSFDCVIFPKMKAPELLLMKWLANPPTALT
jgi:hypothetical protein